MTDQEIVRLEDATKVYQQGKVLYERSQTTTGTKLARQSPA